MDVSSAYQENGFHEDRIASDGSEAETEILAASRTNTPSKGAARSLEHTDAEDDKMADDEDVAQASDVTEPPQRPRSKRKSRASASTSGDDLTSRDIGHVHRDGRSKRLRLSPSTESHSDDDDAARDLREQGHRARSRRMRSEAQHGNHHSRTQSSHRRSSSFHSSASLTERARRSKRRVASHEEPDSFTPIPTAAFDHHIAASMARAKGLDHSGRTALAQACAEGDFDAVQSILRRPNIRRDIDKADYSGNTPLQIASLDGVEEIVQALIDEGCGLHFANYEGDTPLIDAVTNGHVEVVKILIDTGVNPRRKNNRGKWAFDFIPSGSTGREIEEILKRGIVPGSDTKPELTPEKPASIQKPDDKKKHYVMFNQSVMKEYAELGDMNGVYYMIEGGVKPDNTSAVAAAQAGHAEVLSLLMAHGAEADPDPVKKKFVTPMLAAIGRGNLDVIKLLLEQTDFARERKTIDQKTYAEIAAQRQGPHWSDEVLLLQGKKVEIKKPAHAETSKLFYADAEERDDRATKPRMNNTDGIMASQSPTRTMERRTPSDPTKFSDELQNGTTQSKSLTDMNAEPNAMSKQIPRVRKRLVTGREVAEENRERAEALRRTALVDRNQVNSGGDVLELENRATFKSDAPEDETVERMEQENERERERERELKIGHEIEQEKKRELEKEQERKREQERQQALEREKQLELEKAQQLQREQEDRDREAALLALKQRAEAEAAEAAEATRLAEEKKRIRHEYLETLPLGLSKALELGTDYPRHYPPGRPDVRTLKDWTPICLVLEGELDPNSNVAPNEKRWFTPWMMNWQAAVLLGHSTLDEGVKRYGWQSREMSQEQRQKMFRLGNPSRMLSRDAHWNMLKPADKTHNQVLANCPIPFKIDKGGVHFNWTDCLDQAEKKFYALPNDQLFWIRFEDFVPLTTPDVSPHLQDIEWYTQTSHVKPRHIKLDGGKKGVVGAPWMLFKNGVMGKSTLDESIDLLEAHTIVIGWDY